MKPIGVKFTPAPGLAEWLDYERIVQGKSLAFIINSALMAKYSTLNQRQRIELAQARRKEKKGNK